MKVFKKGRLDGKMIYGSMFLFAPDENIYFMHVMRELWFLLFDQNIIVKSFEVIEIAFFPGTSDRDILK